MERHPVIICGAGPVGLTMSILLSREGIHHLLVERRPRVSTLPRARGVMSRSSEIWSQLGLYEELSELSLPPEWNHHFLYLQTLAGEMIGKMPSNCMGPAALAAYTPYDFRCAAQDKIDSMLWRKAESHSHAKLRFSTEIIDTAQDADGVTVTLRGQDGSQETVAADWLIAADGGRSPLREAAGIASTGPTALATYLNTFFDADLSQWTKDRKGPLIWTFANGKVGTFQALDGKTRWMCQINVDPEREPIDSWTEEKVIRRLRDMVGDPAVEQVAFTLHSFYPYTIAACVADRLRDGRMFLVGDAAHRIPPAGGFGMNTGIQSAHNLAWKLAAVIRGEAQGTLLDTYDPERREVAWRACEFGRINVGSIRAIMTAPGDAEKREAIEQSRQFGNWAGLDVGVHYEGAGAYITDNAPAPERADPVVDYVPTAKPGYRAPHIWLRDGERRLSTIDLFQRRFTLLAGRAGQAWIAAARRLTSPVQAFVVGPGGDLVPEADFNDLYGIDDRGAVLVRPDGHVAWRSTAMVDNPEDALRSVMERLGLFESALVAAE